MCEISYRTKFWQNAFTVGTIAKSKLIHIPPLNRHCYLLSQYAHTWPNMRRLWFSTASKRYMVLGACDNYRSLPSVVGNNVHAVDNLERYSVSTCTVPITPKSIKVIHTSAVCCILLGGSRLIINCFGRQMWGRHNKVVVFGEHVITNSFSTFRNVMFIDPIECAVACFACVFRLDMMYCDNNH